MFSVVNLKLIVFKVLDLSCAKYSAMLSFVFVKDNLVAFYY